jgi:cobalt-zinc-cadmium efflux system membrane fusion protein
MASLKELTMSRCKQIGRKVFFGFGASATLAIAATIFSSACNRNAGATTSQAAAHTANPSQPQSLELTQSQLKAVKIEPVGTYLFPVEREAVGNIDFDEDLSVPVFPPYQGRIISTRVVLGDVVQKGQALYTIDSPDLIQAESVLIGAAATYDLTSKELARAKDLNGSNGVSERELEQARSDEQTADGALKAARDAVRVFGKPDADIDRMIASRKIDPALVVHSPIAGQITTMDAQPGLFVQPGNLPAPYTVSKITTKWMLAEVPESDFALYHEGQPLEVKVTAFPDKGFRGTISKIYANVDPNTHRITVRSEVADSTNQLLPGMLANFMIRVQKPVEATAVPSNGIVRESDGTMTAWVTTDRRHFAQRIVKTGLRKDDRVQILDGVQPGELVVSDGAVFLSNMLQAPAAD